MTRRQLISVLLAGAFVVLVPLVHGALAGRSYGIPNHAHWTVAQCVKYWEARSKNLHVVYPAATAPRPPSAAELDPKQYLVQANDPGSRPGDPPTATTIVVLLEPTGTTAEVRKVPVVGGMTKLESLNSHYTAKQVTLYWSGRYDAEELNPYDSTRQNSQCLYYQGPWVEGPVYEGGSIGVVINGSVYDLAMRYLSHAVGVALALISLYMGFRKSAPATRGSESTA